MSRIKKTVYAVFLVAALSLTACGEDGGAKSLYGGDSSENLPAPEQVNYKTAEVAYGEYIKTAEGTMRMYYPITANLSWEGDNAIFREILVKKGQEVKKGDSLATFDIEISSAYREELRLELARKNEDFNDGKEERLSAIEKAKENMVEGLRTDQLKLDKLETEYEKFVFQSEWEIARLKKNLDEIEEALANDTLTAPFDGVIDSVATYNPGDLVRPDQVIVTMHAEDKFYLAADDTSGRLRYNVEVTVEAGRKNDRKFYEGRVVAAPNILPASVPKGMGLIELYGGITLQELEGNLRYQFNVEELQNVLLVDWSAVTIESGKNFVYVLDGDMVQKRYIISGLTNRREAWVLDGLYEGQNVIAD